MSEYNILSKIKTIDDLGISPYPWKAVLSSDEMDVATFVKDANYRDVDMPYIAEHDSLLIAAAPELYECLREATHEMCSSCSDDLQKICASGGRKDCFVTRWRKALAKANGEEIK